MSGIEKMNKRNKFRLDEEDNSTNRKRDNRKSWNNQRRMKDCEYHSAKE